MITAQFPDGHEITRNSSHFRSTNVPPELVLQRESDHDQEEDMYIEPVSDLNEQSVAKNMPISNQNAEQCVAKNKGKRNIRKPKRLIEEDK